MGILIKERQQGGGGDYNGCFVNQIEWAILLYDISLMKLFSNES